ncbi:MarR family transcriptional regulator [Paenibacillus sepulcri]|uniref:MarR family transcriptional regulator n=1 Tax=Paenibacillus sepulcri TaxID=359917 RepID=A0ABS7C813_9BACL|nr:MarR family transcriptional regulator [Paenibacillus sepulcri]
MNDNLKTKQYIHGLFIHFLHLKEQYEERESGAFLGEVQKVISFEAPLNMTEIHVIACIGEHEPINLTAIADRMDISKGNISKICAKLVKQDWARKTQLSDNKKEIFFRLTSRGKKLFDLHEELHVKAQEQFMSFLGLYNETELEFAKRFLGDIIQFYDADKW